MNQKTQLLKVSRFTAQVTTNGRVTIPYENRQANGIEDFDYVELEIKRVQKKGA